MDAPPFYFVSKWVRHAFAFFSLLDGDAERGALLVSNNLKTNLFTMTNDELQSKSLRMKEKASGAVKSRRT